MQIADILSPASVKMLGALSSKKRLFNSLAEIAEAAYGFDAASVADALMDREGLGPTGVGHGVALPHARLEGLDEVKGLFVRLEKPLEFDSVDRMPVDLVFTLFAPEDAGVDHLKALALVSRTMRNADICAKLRANSESSVLHTILTEVPATQAA